MEDIFGINMEENNNFVLLNSLAMSCLDRKEYADFLTVMKKIRDRSIPVLEHLRDNQQEAVEQLRYPHDIELILQCKIFKNNQRGERVELSTYTEVPLLVKVPLDQEPRDIINNICNYIVGINK
jgi:hypothetical protein